METLTSEEYNNQFQEHLEKTDKELYKCNGFDLQKLLALKLIQFPRGLR
ncbi:hypothetical protein [uncultured Nostoc sp.]